ncbi:MBL fold metallo-hydrolase [Acidithrix sp. C25]|uniref:MBL fold metallo-hydrolase n=1 Tax=Acidithrix sp. C25 TaxID=1671482 RepID=UPI00191BA8A0|nr:MBL fold metallo-hydrolase [Acidithrix sp. C25]CAG4916421.1 unnamed protein product [Acidithrix sp. C25]
MSANKENRYEWEEPGAFEVVPNVYRIPLPLPGDSLRAVNVYLLLGSDRVVLIDSGQFLEVARKALTGALALVGVEVGDVSEFLITHIHRDHYTQAIALRREFHGKVSIGAGERSSFDMIQRNEQDSLERQFGLLRLCGAQALYETVSAFGSDDSEIINLYERPDDWLYDGTVLHVGGRNLSVISTPGHTRGHVVFLDSDSKVLFAGDHVLPHITPSIALEADRPRLPLGDYLGSLNKVRQMPDSMLLPAHGPVVPSSHKRIDELLLHHDLRLRQTYSALGVGGMSAFEVARHLKWTRRETDLGDLDLFNSMLAIFETKYHLDLLVELGVLSSKVEDEVEFYAPKATQYPGDLIQSRLLV